MNYLKIYCQLIRKAQGDNKDLPKGQYENHHIFPQSIFGINDKTVKLTARQHLFAHVLLARAFERRYGLFHSYTRKMNAAVHRMTFGNDHRKLTSRQYQVARDAAHNARIGVPTINEQTIARKLIRDQLIATNQPIPKQYQIRYWKRKDRSQYKSEIKRMTRSQLAELAVANAIKGNNQALL